MSRRTWYRVGLLGSGATWLVRQYWAALGVLAAKSAITAGVSYVARRVLPPAV